MATSTGKKARKTQGNRYAAKRSGTGVLSKGRAKRTRTWGQLSHSVARGNEGSVVADNERLYHRVLALRNERGQRLDSCQGVW